MREWLRRLWLELRGRCPCPEWHVHGSHSGLCLDCTWHEGGTTEFTGGRIV